MNPLNYIGTLIGENITFANPEMFWLLLIIPFLFLFSILHKTKRSPSLKFSQVTDSMVQYRSLRTRLRYLPNCIRFIALSLIIVALARPQVVSSEKDIKTEGIDIVISMDVSSSMEAEDFKPNRLEAAKTTAKEFIDYRLNDRIGLVIFAAESFTQCPVTIDHDILKSFFKDIKTKMLQDGTAIGMGLSTAVNRLKDSKAKSKVIILLTDGVNNTGKISPMTAADLAKSYGIRVYTIGVGTQGKAPYLADTPFGKQYVYVDVEIDEDLLREIASYTGGNYFRATSNKALENIYKSIDKMEKTKINEKSFTHKEDKFYLLLALSIILLCVEFILKLFVFSTLP